WIGQRGGGVCMVGGEHSFSSGGWDQTPLAARLPVELRPGGTDWVPGETVHIVPELPASPHPLWSLVADDKQNRKIASDFPSISGVNRWAGARRNLTTVLATTPVAGASGPEASPRGAALMPRGLSGVLDALVGAAPATPQTTPATSAAGSLSAVVAGRYGRG